MISVAIFARGKCAPLHWVMYCSCMHVLLGSIYERWSILDLLS